MMNKFWMIVRATPGSHQPHALAPTLKHFTMQDAMREAKRLACVHPGETFVILESALTVRLPFQIEKPKPHKEHRDTVAVEEQG